MDTSSTPLPPDPDFVAPSESRVSALFDDALDEAEQAACIDWINTPETARRWREYALIGDALRGDVRPSAEFMARFGARLAAAPTVLAPMRPATSRLTRARWLAAAAAVAAIAWTVLSTVPEPPDALPRARAPSTVGPRLTTPQIATAAPDLMHYLAAHQDFAYAIVLPPQDMRFTSASLAEGGR